MLLPYKLDGLFEIHLGASRPTTLSILHPSVSSHFCFIADEFIDEYDDVEVNEEKLDRMSDSENMKGNF